MTAQIEIAATPVERELTRSQKQAADVTALFRARNPLIWIVTKEEARVEGFIAEAAAAAGYTTRVWDCANGVADISGKKDTTVSDPTADAALAAIRTRAETTKGPAERIAWVMRDLSPWLNGPIGIQTLRQVRNLARLLPGVGRERAQAIVVLSTSGDLPPELADHATLIDWPLPDRAEIAEVLDAALGVLNDDMKATACPKEARDAAIDAAVGLSGEEAAACYARSLVQLKRIDPTVVASEKKRIIARERVLEWFDPLPGGLDAVGGLENLKTWLLARTNAYSAAAREYGLPAPKGVLLVGQSGCGKSLTAKATSTAFACPLLKLDLGALKGKFVGESEGNIRKALRVIEAIGRCVVWIDEIEKAMQGATSGSADGGVSADALGTILNWMQERRGEAFVIATANDVSQLPPELLRKGRFDEIWFVDLPTASERDGVLKAALKANGRGKVKIDLSAVSAACDGFTGAEIAAIVPDALFVGFADKGREITTADLIAAAKVITPLSRTAKEKVEKLREWATSGRARFATRMEAEQVTGRKTGRQVDL